VTRLEKNGSLTVLADRYDGKRLNSPNDLVYRSDGALYFTDTPFGLPKAFDDGRKELPFSGVFCLNDGKLELVSTDLAATRERIALAVQQIRIRPDLEVRTFVRNRGGAVP
jgi:sugar lactone lactonase YvrE